MKYHAERTVVSYNEFPINRRHQGLATQVGNGALGSAVVSFQSIGVTKDWRLGTLLRCD